REIPVEVIDNNTSTVNESLIPDPRVGSTVVVTASNRPEKIVNAPASISVLGVKDFDQFAGSNINEMVSKVNGVQSNRSGVDWIGFNARNFNSGGALKVIELIDGRLAKSALSAGVPLFNMGSYIKDDMEKMEIVFGPQGALYGPNALNAVFNVITKDPRKYQGTTVALSAGNHAQFSGRLRHAQKISNKWAYKLNGEYSAGRDYNFHDSVYIYPSDPKSTSTPERNVDFDFRHIRAEGHLYYSLTPKADLVVSGGAGENDILQPGRNQMRGLRHGFLQGRLVHPNYFLNINNTWGNFGTSYQIAPYTRSFWKGWNQPNPLPPDTIEARALDSAMSKEKSQRLNADAQYNYTFRKAGLFLVGGLNYQLERPNGFGDNLLDSFKHIRITQYGAVLQVEKLLPWNFRFIGAVRYDHHSNYGDFFSPKLGLIKSFGDNSLRITWGKAYAVPSILSQYANVGGLIGNGEGIIYIPNGTRMPASPENYRVTIPVKPEEINSWEFGYKGEAVKNLFVDITYHYNISNNYLSNQSVSGLAVSAAGQRLWPPNRGTVGNDSILRNASFSCSANYGEVHHYGLDVDINYSFNKFISLAVKYSWFGSDITDNNLKNDANRDGYVSLEESNLNTPEHKGIIGLNMQNLFRQKMFLNISTRLVQQYDIYNGNHIGTEAGKGKRGKVYGGKHPVTGQPRYYYKNFDWGPLGGFISIDLNAGYKINKMLSVNMGITNLLNTRQMEAVSSPSIGRLIMFELKVHVPNRSKEKK
ncbi:MAG TPA: TonB-dependent receptor, partial [Chitinophagaceae bacterium]|nr:TonB-dependent receptor [Chitinophagaceae bacterium]